MGLLSGKLGAFIGGAAARGSEILQEERKSAFDAVDNLMADWTRLGVPEIKRRKQLRTKMKTAGEFLRNKGFSNDQIDVAFQQNKYEEVVQHITNLEAAQKDNPELQYKPADIIKLGPNYKDSGRTMDEVLDGVMGKVASGMSTADAIADMGGTGLQGAFMRTRADALSAASGFDVATLRAMATGDLEYSEPIAGDISIVDPVASAQARSALTGGETGMFSSSAAEGNLKNFGNLITGAKGQANAGVTLYIHEQGERAIQVEQEVARLLAEKQEEVGRNRLSAREMNDVKGELVSWAKNSGIYVGPQEREDGVNNIPSFDFSGDPNTIANDLMKAIEGIEDEETRLAAYNAASAEAQKYFEKNSKDAETAARELIKFQADLIARMKQKSTSVSGNPKSVTVKKDAPGIVVEQ
jgi:hypothetical protein